MDELGDDWLFDSIKKYKALHMYDLHQPVTAMDWIDGQSLCVATSSGTKNEILELMLPDKLLADQHTADLMKDRDFRVNCGGFCQREVCALKHVPNTRSCVTADKEGSGVSIWQMGSTSTDVIEKVKDIHVPSSKTSGSSTSMLLSLSEDTPRQLTFGSFLDNICIVDVQTLQYVRDTTELQDNTDLSILLHYDTNTLLCCSKHTGDIYSLDLRDKATENRKQHCHGNKASFWTMCAQCKNSANESGSTYLIQFSSSGELVKMDRRNLSQCIWCVQIPLTVNKTWEYLTIQHSRHKDVLSVSGFDGNVALFNYENWQNTRNESVKPIFIHEGHVATSEQSELVIVVRHIWHPWQPDLIMSAATDGSLHAWEHSREEQTKQ